MGANMARRLKDQGFAVTAVADRNRQAATTLAKELDASAPETLAAVTAAADVIITVVTDDEAMDRIYADTGDSLLQGANGKLFINCATISPATHIEVEKPRGKSWRTFAGSLHGLEHHPGT